MLLIGIHLNLDCCWHQSSFSNWVIFTLSATRFCFFAFWVDCIALSSFAVLLIFIFFLFLVRVPARLVEEEMQAVICPVLLPPGAETYTSRGDEKTGLKEMKADKMETTESWWEDKLGQNLWNYLSLCWSDGCTSHYWSLHSLQQSNLKVGTCSVFFLGFIWSLLASYFMAHRRREALIVILQKSMLGSGHVYKWSPFV